MNKLQGNILHIETSGNLSIVSVAINDQIKLKAIVIETSTTASYLKVGEPIAMLFKETEVVMGTDAIHAISLQNKIAGTIKQIEKGALLSKVILESSAGDITSLISTNAVHQLDLIPGTRAMAMVKLNEVMLSAI